MADAPDTERQAVEPDAREALSVSQLNDRIASIVQDTPAINGVRCIGEVTDLHQNSTALYFTLTDGDVGLPCVIWANRYREMDAELEDGTEVVLEGDIEYWVEVGQNRPQTGGCDRRRRRRPGGCHRSTAKQTRRAWLVRRRAETAAAGVDTADVDDTTAQNLVNDLVDADIVTPVPESRVLVYEPTDTAFDSITQLAVFHRGWTAGLDADADGE